MYCLFCVILCIVYVYMHIVLLPPGGYPIAVNKYITSYHTISYHKGAFCWPFPRICIMMHGSENVNPHNC